MKHLQHYLYLLFAVLILGFPSAVIAYEKEADSTAQLSGFGEILTDTRQEKLKLYLASHGSPLAAEAETFIREADRQSIDWRLVAAIAGTESTFGVHIPSGSYNAWGWGIPTGKQSGIGFKNWADGIATVTEGLRKNYIDRGATNLDEIGDMYAASPVWSAHVRFFLEQIDSFVPDGTESLAVSI